MDAHRLRSEFDELVALLEPDMTSSWIEFGMHLGLEDYKIETIRREEQDVTSRLSRMLRVWMSHNPKGDWSGIVEALRAMGHNTNSYGLAEHIQRHYINRGMYIAGILHGVHYFAAELSALMSQLLLVLIFYHMYMYLY